MKLFVVVGKEWESPEYSFIDCHENKEAAEDDIHDIKNMSDAWSDLKIIETEIKV